MSLSSSSSSTTGKENMRTTFHSSHVSGLIANTSCASRVKDVFAHSVKALAQPADTAQNGTYRQEGHIEDNEVEEHGERRGADQVLVNPRRHGQQRLVLAQAGGGTQPMH